jgi:PAS domain S-box-containing protein
MMEAKNKTILIIDDEIAICEALADFLEDNEYQTLSAENGCAGLELFKQKQPDLILTDLRMPEVDGLDVLREVKKNSPETPIIVVSGTGCMTDSIDALRLGACDFIVKPITDMPILLHAVEKALEHTKLRQENIIYQEKLKDLVHEKTQKLQASEKDLRITLNSIGDAVIATDAKGAVVRLNPVAEELTGWQIKDAKGQPLKEVFNIINLHSDDIVSNAVERVLKNGHKVEHSNHTLLISKDKEKNYHIATSAAPIRDNQNNITGVVLVFRDVTDEYKMQETILKSKNKYSALFTQMKNAFTLHEVSTTNNGEQNDFIFLEANPAFEKLVNLQPKDIIGKKLKDILPEIEQDSISRYKQVVETGVACRFEKYYKLLKKWVEVVAFRPEQGLLATIYTDITEQKEFQTRVNQAEKMEAIGHLAGGIAHDFNNILTGILGYTELSLNLTSIDSKSEKYLTKVLEASRRASRLVKQILSFSRQNNEKKEPYFLQPIINEVLSLLRASLPTSIEIKCNWGIETAPVLANSTKIHEIVMNLCINAAHAMANKGTLKVSCTEVEIKTDLIIGLEIIKPGNYSKITVKDNGSGIAPEIIPHIFEPFFTTKEREDGTGMGLAVIYGITQSHQGHVTVQSEVGVGTEFNIYLPQTAAQTAAQTASPTNDNIELPRGNESILLVDDEEILHEMLANTLRDLGYTVSFYTNAHEALKVFKQKPMAYDLVISDQTMPKMSGLELAEELFKIRAELPIILSSGFSNKLNPTVIANSGIAGFLAKPFSHREIADKIRTVLDKKSIPAS